MCLPRVKEYSAAVFQSVTVSGKPASNARRVVVVNCRSVNSPQTSKFKFVHCRSTMCALIREFELGVWLICLQH